MILLTHPSRKVISPTSIIIKNSWEIKNIIVKKTISDDHVMVSLDVVAMFLSIPLRLVKKRIQIDGMK